MQTQACGRNVRLMTQEERDRREDLEQRLYDEMYAQIEDRQRAEYDQEFGPAFRAAHPFRPNHAVIHRLTTEAIEKAKNEH